MPGAALPLTRSRRRERGLEPPRVEEFMQDNISVHRRKTSAKRKPLGEEQSVFNEFVFEDG